MSRTVHVNLGERSYDVRIGTGLRPAEFLDAADRPPVFLVTDTNVGPLHGDRCEQALRERGCSVTRTVVPAGETSKSFKSLERLCRDASVARMDRSTLVVALGGGMVGDLAGCMAAIYLRGVRLVQVPTSLLAMVDSSVGGKTAIDLPEGKNLVGVFHQPVEVVIDLDVLKTLPDREYLSGLAEVVKYGVIWDSTFFKELESKVDAIKRRDPVVLEGVIARCCEIKAEVVAIDEKESGIRQVLNFGHTLAHALESEGSYTQWLHGEAVSVGMVYAAEVSAATGRCEQAVPGRVRALLEGFGLPVKLRGKPGDGWAALRERMSVDKKTRDRVPRFVLAKGTGAVVFGCEVPEAVLDDTFRKHMTGT